MNSLNKGAVEKFYRGRNIFITGATGFLGKVVVEKVLRSCPEVGSVYCLVRPKQNQNPQKRFDSFVNNKIFERIRHENPANISKIKLISGDIMEAGLGISKHDKELLTDKIDVVFHSAATVKFTEPLRFALDMNTMGTRKIVQLCNEMKALKAFVHVSTAYSNSIHKDIQEKVYPPPMNPDVLDNMPEKYLIANEKMLIGSHPNTYTFTKAMAEHVTATEIANHIPTAIVRPSIVTASASEPYPGWVDNYAAITGYMTGIMRGTYRTSVTKDECRIDIVPVDMVANTMLVSAANVHTHGSAAGVPVIHCTSSGANPIKWGEVRKSFLRAGRETPTKHVLLYPACTFRQSKIVHRFVDLIGQYIPALLADAVLTLRGKQPGEMRAYNSLKMNEPNAEFFSNREWNFEHKNMKFLLGALSEADKLAFNIDFSKIQWKNYLQTYANGIKTFLLREGPGTSEEAKKKIARLYAAQILGKGAFVILGISLIASEVDAGPVLEFAKALPLPMNKTVNMSSD